MLYDNNSIPSFTDVDEILLQDVVKQAEKDIALAGLSHDFKSETADNLVEEMAKFLNQLSGNQLNTLLYSVDLNPKQMDSTSFHQLSSAVWNRVFKKVWFRKSFKTGNK